MLAVLGLAAAGCGAAGADAPGKRLIVPTYLFGTLGQRTFDVQDVCGGEPAVAVALYPTAGTVALGIVTLGVYTPVEVRVECRAPRPLGRAARAE